MFLQKLLPLDAALIDKKPSELNSKIKQSMTDVMLSESKWKLPLHDPSSWIKLDEAASVSDGLFFLWWKYWLQAPVQPTWYLSEHNAISNLITPKVL